MNENKIHLKMVIIMFKNFYKVFISIYKVFQVKYFKVFQVKPGPSNVCPSTKKKIPTKSPYFFLVLLEDYKV